MGGKIPQGPLSHPLNVAPSPGLLVSGLEHLSGLMPLSPSLARVSVSASLMMPCPSLSLSVPVRRRGKQETEPALTTCLWGLGPDEQRMNGRKGGGWGPWRPQL